MTLVIHAVDLDALRITEEELTITFLIFTKNGHWKTGQWNKALRCFETHEACGHGEGPYVSIDEVEDAFALNRPRH